MTERARYKKLVADAKKNITEISPQHAAAKLKGSEAVIIDVRDKDEWDEGHIPGAMHMSRGTLELEIEEKVPDPNALVICHCDGEPAKDGLQNIRSMAGGFKAWKAAGLPTTTI